MVDERYWIFIVEDIIQLRNFNIIDRNFCFFVFQAKGEEING